MQTESTQTEERLLIRVYGEADKPTLIYLPGSHGDWSVIAGFRNQMLTDFRFVEFTYPRTQTWTIEQYGNAIAKALVEERITSGWVLGESFGSQIAWQLCRAEQFDCLGVILCGGFVRHPFPWGAALFGHFCKWLLSREKNFPFLLRRYEKWVMHHYEATPERATSLVEFKSRRAASDGMAAVHRLRLIQHNDPREVLKRYKGPVFYLGGFWDPLVPWYLVKPWLKRNCNRYAGGMIIREADHNVLFSAPTKSARTIKEWIGRLE